MTITGRCLCGAVSYTTDAEPSAAANCHCKDCQRSTSSAFSTMIAIPLDALELTGELSTFDTVGEDSGETAHRRFCATCGSPILSESGSLPGIALVKAGTLDDTSWVKPTIHVWAESSQAWVGVDSSGEGVFPRGLESA